MFVIMVHYFASLLVFSISLIVFLFLCHLVSPLIFHSLTTLLFFSLEFFSNYQNIVTCSINFGRLFPFFKQIVFYDLCFCEKFFVLFFILPIQGIFRSRTTRHLLPVSVQLVFAHCPSLISIK